MALLALGLLAVSTLLASGAPLPIWSSNKTSNFVFLRSPDFTFRAEATSAVLSFTAVGSPRPPEGTTQAKLLGAASIYVNGVLASAGPGHNVPTQPQVVRSLDVLPFIRNGAPNCVGISSFFARAYATGPTDVPRVEATLLISDANGSYNVTVTDTTWTAWPADSYFNPTGNAGVSWYPMPNEYLDRRVYPLGWAAPGFSPASPWPAAAAQPAWTVPLYSEGGAPPVALVRRSACNVTRVNASRQILDFGQEFMGGVNLTFPSAPAGALVTVTVAEELLPGGSGVLSPARTGNRWASTWTLAGDASLDAGVHHHEFIQFRYAQVDGSPVAFAPGDGLAQAWVVQHPAGGDGRNPFELPCAASTPAADAFGTGARARTALGSWSSSNAALDTVWNFTAYTIVGTSLDVNVDGQTRERDVDIVDALNTALGQYMVFSPGDSSVQRRTLLEMFTNDTGMWTQWLDFHTSSVVAAREHALFTGDTGLLSQLWASNDGAIRADGGVYNSLQFEAFLRYFNRSGNGLLHFNANGSCGGSWACEPLVDWPATTRDGYDCGNDNTDDTVRSSFGAMAYGALAQIATWLGEPAAAARYSAMETTVLSALRSLNVRYNATAGDAYFVDGAVGAPASHAAVHSTLYAISAGAADGDAELGAALTAYLSRHGVAPSSCMMGRWWVTGLLRIGVWTAAAADLALDVLTAPGYPSWLNMLEQGATCTMEAWRPADKSNLDWAHPWCASPSFTVPGSVLGVWPLEPGWARWRVAPQTSSVDAITSTVPTPAGLLQIDYSGTATAAGSNATVALQVLPGQATQICLCVPGSAAVSQAILAAAASDVLLVDGSAVTATAWGRLSCTSSDLPPGLHVVSRVVTTGTGASAKESHSSLAG